MVKVSRIHFRNAYYSKVRVKILSTVPKAYKDLVRYECNIHIICRIGFAQPLPDQHLLRSAANRLHRHLG